MPILKIGQQHELHWNFFETQNPAFERDNSFTVPSMWPGRMLSFEEFQCELIHFQKRAMQSKRSQFAFKLLHRTNMLTRTRAEMLRKEQSAETAKTIYAHYDPPAQTRTTDSSLAKGTPKRGALPQNITDLVQLVPKLNNS